jgi:hypothetical protein
MNPSLSETFNSNTFLLLQWHILHQAFDSVIRILFSSFVPFLKSKLNRIIFNMKLLGLLLLVLGLTFNTTCMTINRDINQALEARSTWTFLGCYVDNVYGRAFPNGEAVPGGTNYMTNEVCQSACLKAGFSIAGTEYAGECCRFTFYSKGCFDF